MFEKTSEEACHGKSVVKQFTVLCLDLIIRISVMIVFSGEGPIGLLFVVLTDCLVNETILCFLPQVVYVTFALWYYRFPLVTTKVFYWTLRLLLQNT